MTQPPNPGSGSSTPVGSGERIVRKGECVISIADEVGHFWKTIWNHPANTELKERRGSPHVLLSGDRLHVPPLVAKTVSAGTEAKHRFIRKGIPVDFEIVLEENGEPLANCEYMLDLDGALKTGITDDSGAIRLPIKPGIHEGVLRVLVDSVQRVYPLKFGELDPPHTRSGALGRLQNLGYAAGDDEEEFLLALERFRKDHDLTESTELDDATAAKLADVHGS